MGRLYALRDVVAGVAGGGAFLGFYLGLAVEPLAAAGIAALCYAGIRLMLSPRVLFANVRAGDAAAGSVVLAREIIGEAKPQLDRLDKLNREVKDNALRRKIAAVTARGRTIIGKLEEDPGDANRVRRLLTYYLGATVNIVDHYVVIAAQGDVHQESLDKVSTMLDKIDDAFRRYGGKMVEDDVLKLETELELLEQSLKAERTA
jgi:5-bromo-4-chloroindolyl phosphate hydrolysis protein